MVSTARADSGPVNPKLGFWGSLRWAWRQLTSMRTALVLLMLLAVATIPGSLIPQRNVDPAAVREYLENYPSVGAWLDRVWLFDVYSSPWFSAIYLLLVISLVGCIIPRTRQHWKAMRAQPPRTPRNLARLPEHRIVRVDVSADRAAEVAEATLRRRRFRIRRQDPAAPHEVAGERGYLKETGNLIFHISLLGVILAFAAGHVWGWRGELIIAEGETFTSTAGLYHTLEPGAWVDPNEFDPWVITLDSFTAEFDTTPGNNFGAPTLFRADVSMADAPGEPATHEVLAVNNPVQQGATSIYLLGNGYAPIVTVRDADGEVLYSQATPFLAQDDFYTSTGAIKVGTADPGLGFNGLFLPTFQQHDEFGSISVFADLFNPTLILTVYTGEVFPGGRPQSVYTLDVSEMEQLTRSNGQPLSIPLVPGQTVELPDDLGSVTFDGVVRWAGLVMREDPGRGPVLISAVSMLAGLLLMLYVQRRRVFVRVTEVTPDGDGSPGGRHTEIELGALAKGTDPGLERLLDQIREQIEAGLAEPGPERDRSGEPDREQEGGPREATADQEDD